MVQSSACRSPRQNPHNNKDEPASETLTEANNCCTPGLAATHAPTPAVVPVVTLLVVFGSANSSVVKYLENDL